MKVIEIKSGVIDTRERGRIESVDIEISFNSSSRQILALTREEATDLAIKLNKFLLQAQVKT